MSNGVAARFSSIGRSPGRPAAALAVLAFGAWAGTATGAAAETLDCAGINMGRIDVVLGAGSSTLHTVELKAGDTLAFTFQADTRAMGTAKLVAGDGHEQRLLYGRHATQGSYTAQQAGPVRLHLAAKGGAFASFLTTCTPADGSVSPVDDGLNADIGVPVPFGATASKDRAATAPAIPDASAVQWLSSQPSADTPASTYGVELKLQPALMIGVLAQFDQASDPVLGPNALSNQPWQAGPVTSWHLGDGLVLDARAAWGSADPVIGHAPDRQTLDARLSSTQEAGAWRFSPSISYAHVLERPGAGAEHAVEAGLQPTESGRVDLKPEMAYRIDMGASTYIEPKVMVGAFWNLGDAAAGTVKGASHEARHIAETGITFGNSNGSTLQVGGSVEEGEVRSENVWSGRLQLNIPLE